MLAPDPHRQADAERDQQAHGFQTVLGLIESLPATATAAQLKTQVVAQLSVASRPPVLASGPPRCSTSHSGPAERGRRGQRAGQWQGIIPNYATPDS